MGRALSSGRLSKRGELWVLDYTDGAGRRRRKALSRDRRVAERARVELIHGRDLQLSGLGVVDGQQRELEGLRDAYLADLGTRAGEKHWINAKARLDRALREVRARRVRDLTPLDAIQMRSRMVTEGLSHRTTNLHVDTLRAMLGWAVRMRLIAESPLQYIDKLPETKQHVRCRRRAMTEKEIERFLEAARADDRANAAKPGKDPRVPQTPLWRAFLETGARYGELVAVTWADLDLDAATLRLREETTKAGRERVIPLRTELVGELHALRAVHERLRHRSIRDGERAFLTARGCSWCVPTNNIMRVFDRLLEAAGIDRVDEHGRKLDVHALRHTFATRLARSGVGLVQAQHLLGHSDPKLTARAYTHMDVEDLRASVERLGGVDTERGRLERVS